VTIAFSQISPVIVKRLALMKLPPHMRSMLNDKIDREPARVFRDKDDAKIVRVEFLDHDGGCETAAFSGPRAADRAKAFARRSYDDVHIADDLRLIGGWSGGRLA
jgi:hypothetical protein